MYLNELHPSTGSRADRKRLGRGIGSGYGKTAGRGHKGQTSRAGGYHKVGFEGGQMPLQRRLPKVGFTSRVGRYVAEIRLHELAKVDGELVDMITLRTAGLIGSSINKVKIIASGTLTKAVVIRGVGVTKGARLVIESLGGKIEE